MAGFTELIRTFSRTCDYVRDFFIYGCKKPEEFTDKSISSYYDEKHRVENWLKDYVHQDDPKFGQPVSITVDSGHILENPLYQAYYAKSFTDKDMKLFFLLMDLLADGKPYTVQELTGKLLRQHGDRIDEKTVREKLNEYTEEGLLISQKQGRSWYYMLSPDTFSGFTKQYPGLEDAVRFFTETQPFRIIGNSILRGNDLRNDCFLMKHNYIVHTLEDEILCILLDAMHEGRFLRLTVYPTSSAFSADAKEIRLICVPLQISVSLQTGRRYLIAYQPDFRQFNAHRLDFISDAEPGEVCPEYDPIMEQLRQAQQHVFGVSFRNQKAGETAEPLRMTLRITDQESYILDRVKREMRTGTIERTGEETYCVTLDLFDPQEALPWIRTFTGRILSLEGGTERIRKLFRDDMLAMARLYEKVEHDDIS